MDRLRFSWGRLQITVLSLSAERILDKLAREGVTVFSAQKRKKNEITFEVSQKDRKKVFAILQGSCYNVSKVRDRGLALLYKKCLGGIGLFLGAVLFCLVVFAAQHRVLKIEVIGSGAYYKSQVLDILDREGVKHFSPAPADAALLSAEILALPRVSYCSVKCEGGVLTVEIRVSEEGDVKNFEPLVAPVAGTVEELVVVRGTARVKLGDTVEAGQTIVDPVAYYGETERQAIVIARVKLSFSVLEEFEGTEEQVRAAALLKFGEIKELHIEKTDKGYMVSGTAYADAAMNLD